MLGRSGGHRSILLALLGLTLLVGTAVGCLGVGRLPTPSGVTAVLVPGEGDAQDMILVSWKASRDNRVDGYVIYRAEQGVGTAVQEKTEPELQALTFATQYKDDEIRSTELYPTMRYYYTIAIITADGEIGPSSDEVTIEYSLQS
jgi:hypothetical protein